MQDRIVFLDGKRLYLRPPQKSDLPFFIRWFNDPEVIQFLSSVSPVFETDEARWIEESGKRKNELVLVVVLKGKTPGKDRLIGTMGAHRIEHENGVATLGAAIGEHDCWSKGYGTEAGELMLRHLFGTLRLRKVYAHVFATNPRSRKCIEKSGLTLEATLKERRLRKDKFVDEHILSLTVEAWRIRSKQN